MNESIFEKEEKIRPYECAICGTKYKNLEDRIACETKCLKKRNEDEAAMKKQKLDAEKKARMEEINSTYKKLEDLVLAYVQDYGTFSIPKGTYSSLFF